MTSTKKRKELKPPVFDYEDFLDRIDGDVDLLKEVIEIFLEDMPGLLADLYAAIKHGDAASVERAAHTLKGATANISAKRMHLLAQQVQQSVKKKDDVPLETLIDHFEKNFEELDRELRRYLVK